MQARWQIRDLRPARLGRTCVLYSYFVGAFENQAQNRNIMKQNHMAAAKCRSPKRASNGSEANQAMSS